MLARIYGRNKKRRKDERREGIPEESAETLEAEFYSQNFRITVPETSISFYDYMSQQDVMFETRSRNKTDAT